MPALLEFHERELVARVADGDKLADDHLVHRHGRDHLERFHLLEVEERILVRALPDAEADHVWWRSFLKIATNPLLLHNFKLKRGG